MVDHKDQSGANAQEGPVLTVAAVAVNEDKEGKDDMRRCNMHMRRSLCFLFPITIAAHCILFLIQWHQKGSDEQWWHDCGLSVMMASVLTTVGVCIFCFEQPGIACPVPVEYDWTDFWIDGVIQTVFVYSLLVLAERLWFPPTACKQSWEYTWAVELPITVTVDILIAILRAWMADRKCGPCRRHGDDASG